MNVCVCIERERERQRERERERGLPFQDAGFERLSNDGALRGANPGKDGLGWARNPQHRYYKYHIKTLVFWGPEKEEQPKATESSGPSTQYGGPR